MAIVMRPCAPPHPPCLCLACCSRQQLAQRDMGSETSAIGHSSRYCKRQLRCAETTERDSQTPETPSSSHSSRRTTACRLPRNKQFSATQRAAQGCGSCINNQRQFSQPIHHTEFLCSAAGFDENPSLACINQDNSPNRSNHTEFIPTTVGFGKKSSPCS